MSSSKQVTVLYLQVSLLIINLLWGLMCLMDSLSHSNNAEYLINLGILFFYPGAAVAVLSAVTAAYVLAVSKQRVSKIIAILQLTVFFPSVWYAFFGP